MEYRGIYKAFDPNQIHTVPIRDRANRVTVDHLLNPQDALSQTYSLPETTLQQIHTVAQAIIDSKKNQKPVIFFTGAHFIKNGLGLLLIDLIERRLISLIAGNGATSIHDFELALIGQTSEDVPNALEKGTFGMAREFALQNLALRLGNQRLLGYGESLGKMITEPAFQNDVFALAPKDCVTRFSHPSFSVLAASYQNKIPFTVHVGIGTDVLDQHPSFDGAAKGACSARDFLLYTEEVTKLTQGGVILNVGSAVTGPEVFLKAASMACNIGKVPHNILTADFDLRPFDPSQMKDESAGGYYCRDQKSVVTRVPHAYHGKGLYIQGNQKITLPALYQSIIERLSSR